MSQPWKSADEVIESLARTGYIASPEIATTVFLAATLDKPILAEGPAGVGKTELAKALAEATGRELIRLQCYEGLDEGKTLYEWKYAKQLLYTQMLRERIEDIVSDANSLTEAVDRIADQEDAFFSERFISPRPLLRAMQSKKPTVLLVDEIDRAEDELEAFLLEVTAEFQVTIPELGTVRANSKPLVVMTSNSTRELSDALRRRCLFLPFEFPDAASEAAIVRSRIPDIDESLATALASFVSELREQDLKKAPSIAEVLDWARGLMALGAKSLEPELAETTLTLLVKYPGDLEIAQGLCASLRMSS